MKALAEPNRHSKEPRIHGKRHRERPTKAAGAPSQLTTEKVNASAARQIKELAELVTSI